MLMIVVILMNFDEKLWGIKYVYTLYLHLLYFKCSLDFFTFLTFLHVFIRFKLVLGPMCASQGAIHVRKEMLKTCWSWHAEESNMAKQFGESLLDDLVHTVFVYALFLFDASTKKLFVSFHYHVFFFFLSGCCGSSGKYCK